MHAWLVKHRAKLEARRHFFTEQLVNRWNSLDQCTLNASTVNAFKNGLQQLKQSWIGFLRGLTSRLVWPHQVNK